MTISTDPKADIFPELLTRTYCLSHNTPERGLEPKLNFY
jgi:hypothetical protein